MIVTERLVLLGVVAGGLMAAAGFVVARARPSPEKKERARRLALQNTGRLVDGVITDAQDHSLYFTYAVRGVSYAASQDTSGLQNVLPENASTLIGPATVKYAPQNPANSIVVAENWSGLRWRQSSQQQNKEPDLK